MCGRGPFRKEKHHRAGRPVRRAAPGWGQGPRWAWGRRGCASARIRAAEDRAARGSSLPSARLFSEVGSGRARCLCVAELQPEPWEAEEVQLQPGSREDLDSSLAVGEGQPGSTPPSHASQPHGGQPQSQRDHAFAGSSRGRLLPHNFPRRGGGGGMGLLLLLLQGKCPSCLLLWTLGLNDAPGGLRRPR